ncbi:MAG: glycoside hydrolase family 108 protein [Alphaproteobacteria bacterium]
MSGSVDELLDEVIAREGGFVHHPADRGGPTKFGITQRTLSEWLGRPATIDEVRQLDEETAREIYVARYLAGPRIDTLPPEIVGQVFDMAVNHAPRRAVRILQEVLGLAGWRVDGDGVIGPQTRRAAFEAQAEMGPFLTNAVADQRANFYRRLVAADPSQGVFLRGWFRRAEAFKVPVEEDVE